MSIQTQIDRIISHVSDAHEKVKAKGGTTAAPYLIANLADAIDTIPEAVDPKLQSKTVAPSTSSQTVRPDSGYDGLSQVTVNAMPTATQATPSISVDSAGKITASATQSAGYVSSGTKSATKQLTTQAAKTVTPSTSEQTAVTSGVYTTGAVKVAGDANLVADNIKSGVSIFGVTGNYEGSGGSGGSLNNVSGTATYTVEDPMYEPGSKLYSIGLGELSLADVLALKVEIVEEHLTQFGDYDDTKLQVWCVKPQTTSELNLITFGTFNSCFSGFFNIMNNQLYFAGNINSSTMVGSFEYLLKSVTFEAITV